MPRPSKYPEQFRLDAVELVRSSPGRSLREIGRELGVNHETLRGWVNAAKRAEQNIAGRDSGAQKLPSAGCGVSGQPGDLRAGDAGGSRWRRA
ncbi:transposase [Micromonospora sp. ATA51]|uniref:transposase n=1 Tax=Micromonospora sicca TaxID=2202420 RepID=UPI0013749E26|nr:transposase [Micromonospora sp. ATA51]